MQEKDALALLKKYAEGKCTNEERAILESWYLQHEADEIQISDEQKQQQLDEVFQALFEEKQPVKRLFPYKLLAAAAVLLAVLGVTAVFINQNRSNISRQAMADINLIKAGGNRATLLLSNGNSINLQSSKNGQIARETDASITKISSGQIVYNYLGNGPQTASGKINKISTPNGGQYQVTLSDGTRVWLNAASTLEYPSSFTGKERNVKLSGEAYFEVAKNPNRPFKVHARNVNIRVLGTHFNVMAYPENGEVKTTLLEGAVRLDNDKSRTLLKPGQQGYMVANASTFKVANVNVSKITAWKQGWFEFDNTNLHTLMGDIARWYDVKVEIAPGVKDDVFFGRIPRSSNLAGTLKILEAGGLHFELNNQRTLIVKP